MKEIGKNSGGFTLIELLVAMPVASFVFVLIYTAYAAQQKSHFRQQMKADMQQSLRAAICMMSREMRRAAFDPHGNSGAEILQAHPLYSSSPWWPMGMPRTTIMMV